MARRSRTLRFKLLMGLVLLAVVGWSVMWFVAATIADRQVEKAELIAGFRGAIAECVERRVTGFPFRIEVRCGRGSRAILNGTAIALDGLTVAALVYNPSRLIIEAAGPVEIQSTGLPPIRMDWELAHASARLDLGERALDRFDGEVLQVRLKVGGAAKIAMRELDVNVRRDPADGDDLDAALRIDNLTPLAGGQAVSLAVRASLGGGAILLNGSDPELLLAQAGGLPLTIEAVSVESGTLQLAATGDLVLQADGLIDGELDIAIAGHDGEVPYVAVMAPQAQATVTTLVKNILAFAPQTTIGDRAAKKLTLTVADSKVRAGLVPLFDIPKINLPTR